MSLQVFKHLRRDCKVIFSARQSREMSAYRQDDAEKSRYQREEEGKKPRIIHGEEYPDWRKPWSDRKNEQYSMLRPFMSEQNPKPDILYILSQIPYLNKDRVVAWWKTIKYQHDVENQKYMAERVERLGSNLAAAHFFLYRKCSIRWRNSNKWIKGYITDPNTDVKLPMKFEEGYFLEAIDASTFHKDGIRYEGLENIESLHFLKWLSLRNNKFVDVWCIDRVAGSVGLTLEYLDVSGCPLNVGGVVALSRLPQLKVLVVTEPEHDSELEAALADLEKVNTNLVIKYVSE